MLVRTEANRILSIFDILKIPVLIVDGGRCVAHANASAEGLLGYESADLAGRNLTDLMAPTDPGMGRERPESFADVLSSGEEEQRQFEAVCRKKNGDEFPAQVALIAWNGKGHELVVIQDISDQKRLEQRASQRRKELSVFNTFSEILNAEDQTDAIMQRTVEMLVATLGVKAALIHLKDPEADALHLRAHAGYASQYLYELQRLRTGEGLAGKVLASGRPLVVKQASEDPRVTNINTRATGIQSIAAVPISSRGVVWGVLSVMSRRADYFTSMDMQLLATLGSQVGVAVENVGLIGKLQEKMSQIELSNELSSIINSSLSIGTLFRIMVAEMRKLIAYDRASLLLYDDKENHLVIFALDTDMKTHMPKGMVAPLAGTSAGWVVQHNEPWINTDLLRETPFPLDEKLLKEGIRATISLPLYQERMLGVFNLDSKVPGAYRRRDLDLLLPVARQMSAALEKALLFETISREKREWEKTFDAFTDMVWIDDLRHRIVRANQAMLKKAGLSVSALSGMRCTELLQRLRISSQCLCCETAATNRESFREVLGEEGSIFHFASYPLMDDEGRLYAILHNLRDVTNQKRLEQQVVRTDKLASLVTLVAGIAHEINNPLGIIAGYAEALLSRAEDPALLKLEAFEDFPEYLDTIHQEIFRCKETLGSLLEFARPHRARARELDINETIKEVILLVNHRAKRLHCRIEQDLERDLPKIDAEPGSLRQLFVNIIINSLYHTCEGGTIAIRTGLEQADGSPGRIAVSIRDTGAGIPAEILDKIFDPFFTTKPVGEGSGLGLAICHKIVEEHGGVIEVESSVGRGTTFTIKLPTKENDDTRSGSG